MVRIRCLQLEADFETKFFRWCADDGITLLTVSHSPAVCKHHTHELRLDGSGGAQLVAISSKA